MSKANIVKKTLFDESGGPSLLFKVICITLFIHLFYWFALPYQGILDYYTGVPTLWESGWFRTVPFEYSKLCVEHDVLPYTKPDLPGYPFKYLEYPFLVGYSSYLIYLISNGNFNIFTSIFQLVNIIFQVGIASLIFLIAKLFHSEKRSKYLAYSYSSMPSILWHSMSRYDPIPTFFLLLSLYLFIVGRKRIAYVTMALGAMFKIFPALLGLIYLKNGYQNRQNRRYYLELIGFPSAIMIGTISPLLILNPSVLSWLFGFLGGFGWNWESIWGAIDQFLRPIFPSLAFFFINQISMRVIFILAVLSVLALSVKSRIEIVTGLAYVILCWLQTQWFFSPQYIVWISPLLLILSFSNRFLSLYFFTQIIMYLEIPSPFYLLAPISGFHFTLIFSSIRIVLFFIFIILLIGNRLKEKIEF